jgi:hypothetical protein
MFRDVVLGHRDISTIVLIKNYEDILGRIVFYLTALSVV